MECDFLAVFRFFPTPTIGEGISLTNPIIGIGFDKNFKICSDYRTRQVILIMVTYSDYRTTINITILYELLHSVLYTNLNVKKMVIDIRGANGNNSNRILASPKTHENAQ